MPLFFRIDEDGGDELVILMMTMYYDMTSFLLYEIIFHGDPRTIIPA